MFNVITSITSKPHSEDEHSECSLANTDFHAIPSTFNVTDWISEQYAAARDEHQAAIKEAGQIFTRKYEHDVQAHIDCTLAWEKLKKAVTKFEHERLTYNAALEAVYRTKHTLI